MDITGILKTKGEAQQVSEKFKKLDFVLTDNSTQYTQHISFQLTQDKCSLIDKYKAGDEVKVHFNLRGREWTSPQGEVKYFNTLEAWRLEGNGTGTGTPPATNNTAATSKPAEQSEISSPANEGDDLPF